MGVGRAVGRALAAEPASASDTPPPAKQRLSEFELAALRRAAAPPYWMQLLLRHTLVAFGIGLAGSGSGLEKTAGTVVLFTARATAAPAQAVHVGCVGLLAVLSAGLALRWVRVETGAFGGLQPEDAWAPLAPFPLLAMSSAGLAGVLLARFLFWPGSLGSAPQQVVVWSLNLAGFGACAHYALELQVALDLTDRQETDALLQWMMACAIQWMLLEPILACASALMTFFSLLLGAPPPDA